MKPFFKTHKNVFVSHPYTKLRYLIFSVENIGFDFKYLFLVHTILGLYYNPIFDDFRLFFVKLRLAL